MKPSVKSKLLHFTSVFSICAASAAIAEDVTLRSNDGNVELVGELVGFDNVVYQIKTVIGEINARVDEYVCIGADCPELAARRRNAADADTVTISGSDTVGEGLMPILLSGYAGHLDAEEQINKPDGTIEAISMFVGDQGFGDDMGSFLVRSSISSDAFANLLGRSADIGMSGRRITPDEARTLRSYGAGSMIDPTNEHIIAIDSLVIITHPNNPVSQITMAQLRGIYDGQITNWSELGGQDAPINVVQLGDGTGTRSVFESRVFEGNRTGSPALSVTASGSEKVSVIVNEDESAIGYVSAAFARGAQLTTLISDCNIPMIPDAFSARTEEYNLGRFLYLYTRGDNTKPEVRNLLNYITSNDADDVVKKSGFTDLGVSRRPQSADSARAQAILDAAADAYETDISEKMLNDMATHDRLSTTFRFRTASQKLTPRSQLNIARLTNYLEGLPSDTEIKLVGFTDSVGAFSSNLDLSADRAASFAQTLQEFAGDRLNEIQISTAGYGEIAPASCNTDENGRSINRRVEVWIKSTG